MGRFWPGALTIVLPADAGVDRTITGGGDTVGLRVPDHPVAQALLAALGEPLLTSTLILPGDDAPLTEGWEIRERLDHQLDLVLDGGPCGIEPTTIIDLTTTVPELVRQGRGPLAPFGLA